MAYSLNRHIICFGPTRSGKRRLPSKSQTFCGSAGRMPLLRNVRGMLAGAFSEGARYAGITRMGRFSAFGFFLVAGVVPGAAAPA